MNYLEFDFDIDDQLQLEKLVALLSSSGFEGFEEEEDSLKAYIPEHQFDEAMLSGVLDKFSSISYTTTVIENINWNKKWEEDFNPVLVDDFVAIRAGFHPPVKNVEHEIIITPKMSFGTGHHATTYLVIQQMRSLDFTGKSVLDFGTGTGVLAILARKLGAKMVLAIDYDEWSIKNTGENIVLNLCSGIRVLQANVVPEGGQFDIVLANINLNVILANLQSIATCCSPGATVLFSGFLAENEAEMVQASTIAGFRYLSTFQRGDWIVIMAQKR